MTDNDNTIPKKKTRLMEEFDKGTDLFYKRLKDRRSEESLMYCLSFCKIWIEYAHQRCDDATAQYILTRVSRMIQDAEVPPS